MNRPGKVQSSKTWNDLFWCRGCLPTADVNHCTPKAKSFREQKAIEIFALNHSFSRHQRPPTHRAIARQEDYKGGHGHSPHVGILNNEHFEDMLPKKTNATLNQPAKPSHKKAAEHRRHGCIATRTSLKCANAEGDLEKKNSPLELSGHCANMLSQCTVAEINLAGELLAKRAQEGLLSTHITHLTNGENMGRIWSWNYPSFFRSWRNWTASKPAPSRPPALL